ncbi:MAG: glycosyltransferase family 4 protein [Candidatus Omnitrophica bacterium]|nr:glycosyltransferase family 4 protein [Candidatus Omnitrophota bacterium]
MNILILATHLNPGGISRYVITLAKNLVKLNHQVWIACEKGQWEDKLKNSGVHYKYIPIKTKSIFSPKVLISFFYLLRFIRQNKIDLIHANTRVSQFLGFLIYKFSRIPYISTFHGFYSFKLSRKLFKFSGLLTIAVSEAVKEYLIRDFKFDSKKIIVVHNGLDIEEFSKSKVKREDWGFTPSNYLVGILGRISEEKGHLLAIEAMEIIMSKYQNIYFLISGEGRLKKELERAVNLSKIKERVKFLALEANNFLDIIDLLLMPSRKEGFGYSIIEAFAKGVPVVGYNTGGIAEIIRNRQNGILFYNYDSITLANVIEEVFLQKSLREKIITQARKDVLYFGSELMAKNTEKVYKSIL